MIKFSKHLIKFVLESNSARLYRNVSICRMHQINNRCIMNDDFIEPAEYAQFKYEKIPSRSRTISKLRELFGCSLENAEDIIKYYPILVDRSISQMNEIVSFCDRMGVTHDVLCQNPWILGLKIDELINKCNIIEEVKPRLFNDFVPFLQLKSNELEHVTKIMISEAPDIPERNRLYYFQVMTKFQAHIIASHFARRWFVYEVPFLYFRHNLKYLLDSGVTPTNLLKDLWIFKYHPSKVRQRISVAKRANSKTIRPWMVRCQSSVFDRFIERTKQTNTLLANRSIEDFLSDKLKCDTDIASFIVRSCPSIRTINIIKIQDTLDYLLGEGYTAMHIAQIPRILSHSLETTKQRMEEIKKLNDKKPPTLLALCKSKREYLKYLAVLERKAKALSTLRSRNSVESDS